MLPIGEAMGGEAQASPAPVTPCTAGEPQGCHSHSSPPTKAFPHSASRQLHALCTHSVAGLPGIKLASKTSDIPLTRGH